MKKRGLSPVIAVVLLLMITIIAAGIIVTVVVPFVQNNLDDSKACFEVLGDLSVAETPFNCYNATDIDANGRTGFSVRVDNDEIVGFRVSLVSSGASDAFNVEDGDTQSTIRMLQTDFNQPLQVPQKGGIRTYVASGIFDKIELFPILASGSPCDMSDDVTIVQCEDVDAIGNITQF